MNNARILKTAAVLLCAAVLFAFGAAAAEDTAVYAGTYEELAAAAQAGATHVIITADIKYSNTADTIVFHNAITLESAEGGQYVIDGNGRQILCVQGADSAQPLTEGTLIQNLTFQNSYSTTLHADIYGSGAGGALFVQGSLTLANCVFDNNFANIGGAVCADGTLIMTGCTISGNGAVKGGGVCVYAGDASISDCSFTDNDAETYGGGLYVFSGDLQLSASTFSQNSAEYGAGMCGYGGAVSVADCVFDNNLSSYCGGGLYLDECTAVITNTAMGGNSAQYGSGLCVYTGTLLLSGGQITGNDAGYGGGGLYLRESTGEVIDSQISGNTAMYGGGAYVLNSSLSLSGGAVSGNTGSENGGGVYLKENSTADDADGIISGNEGGDLVDP